MTERKGVGGAVDERSQGEMGKVTDGGAEGEGLCVTGTKVGDCACVCVHVHAGSVCECMHLSVCTHACRISGGVCCVLASEGGWGG